jgi:hypothetical protein
MTKRSLRLMLGLDGFFGGAALLLLGAAGLMPACGGGSGTGHGGAGGHGGSGAGGGGGAPLLGPCGFLDVTEPNETRDTATPILVNAPVTGCIGTQVDLDGVPDDIDVYACTAPATDLAGGYVVLSFTEVGITGSLDVFLYSATDNSLIDEFYTGTAGASLSGYLAVAPGVTYRVQVKRFAGQTPLPYKMLATYTALADVYEPNDTKATAKPIAVGTPITAFQSSGYIGDPYDAAAFADWYSVPLAAGMVTIKMTNVPTDIRGGVHLFDPEGVQVDEATMIDAGANVTLTPATPVLAGTYTIQVLPYAGGPPASDMSLPAAPPPDHFTRPYTLMVTQP